ncbi:MAG: hypothetical protein JHC30_05515 [Caldisericum sp.]|jgi:peptidase E|nr:hypothetical protein [Caldisericum sp.]
MRQELIELMRQFKQDVIDLETAVVFIAEEDFERIKEYLEKFQKVLKRHQEKALELETKINTKEEES